MFPGIETDDDDPFIPYDQLAERGFPQFTRPHLRNMMAKGQFPLAYEISANRIAWKLSELKAWKANRPRRVPAAA